MRRKDPEQTLEEFLREPEAVTRSRKARQRHDAAEARLALYPREAALTRVRTTPKPPGIQIVEDEEKRRE
jgi:hypothetical protein